MALSPAEQKRFDQGRASDALEGIEYTAEELKRLQKAWEDLDGLSYEEKESYITRFLETA